MPLIFDHERGTHSIQEDDHPVLRKFFKRREPQGDAADFVQVRGLHRSWENEEAVGGLVVQCTAFGAVPEGWSSPTAVYGVADFEAEYEPYDPSATEARLAALEATAAAEAARIDANARRALAVELRVDALKKEKTR